MKKILTLFLLLNLIAPSFVKCMEKQDNTTQNQKSNELPLAKRSFLGRFVDTITPSPLKHVKFFVNKEVTTTVGLKIVHGTILVIDATAIALAGYEAACGITSLANKFGWTTKELNYALPLDLIPNKAKEVIQKFILNLATKLLDEGQFIKFAEFVGIKLNWSKNLIIKAAKQVLDQAKTMKLATTIGVSFSTLQKIVCKFSRDCLTEEFLDQLH